MIEQKLSPSYIAFQEARSVLEALAGVNHPRPIDPEPLPPSPLSTSKIREVPGNLPTPHWSEDTLRILLESLPDAVVVVGRQGAIVLVNEQAEKMFGYKRDELLRQPIEILLPERYRQAHIGMRDSYFVHPKSRPMGAQQKLFGRRKDGVEFPVEISLSPLRTEQGIFATSVIRDISQRRREEAKFRTLVENIPAVTFFAPLDESAPELYVSPQIVKLLGFTQKEWLEDPVLWHRQLHPEDRLRWNRQFAPTCASGKTFEEIYRFIAKDGRVVWVHGSASVVRDEDGTPSFLQGVAFDITTIKEAEAELREQARLAILRADVGSATTQTITLPDLLQRCVVALTEHLGVAFARIWTFNEQDQMLHLQASAGLYTHLDGPHSRVPLGQFKVGMIAASRQSVCTNDVVGDPRIHDQTWAKREGMVAFAGYPLLIEDHLVGVLAMFSRQPFSQAAQQTLELLATQVALGIERKWAEEALRRSNLELEQRVKERTQELERFAYVASHDLTEPLRTLKNYPEQLAKEYLGKISDKADKCMNKTLDGVKRLEQLILHLLEYSRVIPGERIVKPTDSAASATKACANLQAKIDESGAQVMLGELPTVLGESAELVILFQNLIMNAIKFRDPNRPLHVEVDCRLDEDYWLFWVRDNGIGIEAKFVGTEGPEAHKLFSLGDDGRVTKRPSDYPGKGYGLHICKKIVTSLGGKIWAESEYGKGTAFFFTLPIVPSSV
jgi:PAS domain S-box-containing protein